MSITRDSVLDKINEITKAATSKVEEITERSRLSFEIAEKEKELAELFRELGKVTYEATKTGSDVITTETLLSIIEEKMRSLDLLKERKYAKMTPTCKSCGSDINDKFDFCPKCGAKLEMPEEPIIHRDDENDSED